MPAAPETEAKVALEVTDGLWFVTCEDCGGFNFCSYECVHILYIYLFFLIKIHVLSIYIYTYIYTYICIETLVCCYAFILVQDIISL